MAMTLYKELAKYYFDIENYGRDFPSELEFLKELFAKHRISNILDLGCGTGEHVSGLSSAGFKTLGVDISPEMIDIAKHRFPMSDFTISDMLTYHSDLQYDSVISTFGTFNYLLDDESVLIFLNNVNASLKQAGIFVVEIWNAEPIQRIKKRPLSLVSTVKSHGTVIQRNRGFKLTQKEESFIVEVNYVYNLNNKDVRDKHTMRVFYQSEIANYMKKAKFEIMNIFSNYKYEKFDRRSGRMVIIAKKK
jgi:SAM-dependent methyltransferase